MKSFWKPAAAALICTLMASMGLVTGASRAWAQECRGAFLRGSIAGEGSRVKLGIEGQTIGCGASSIRRITHELQPYFTYEVSCSTDRRAAAEGLCSTTPCPDFGRFFAFRTIHRPDGSSGPAGFSCVTLEQAVATPGVTVAQVFEAVRRVKLPGGEIGVEPGVRGLANLESFFWVEGADQEPVDLQVGGSTVHAEFRVVEYRWSFGGGEPLVTEGPGSPGLESEVRTTFERRGFYRVGVTVMWVAEAYLDGRRVGEVDALVSRAQTTYPVAELRTVLTG
jgi:hypothetical protein